MFDLYDAKRKDRRMRTELKMHATTALFFFSFCREVGGGMKNQVVIIIVTCLPTYLGIVLTDSGFQWSEVIFKTMNTVLLRGIHPK